jgi:hypothetical protein
MREGMNVDCSDEPRRQHDVFICYTWAGDNKSYADALHKALTDLEVAVFQDDKGTAATDEDELLPGVMASLLGSRVLVPLITPQFHDSPHCEKELYTALTCAYRLERGTTRRVMAVTRKVKPEDVYPRQVKRRRLLTWEGSSAEELAAQIAQVVHEISASDPRRFGDAPIYPDPGWIPAGKPGDRSFFGRDREKWELRHALLAAERSGVGGQPVVAVRAVGGQGKTAMCEQYARWAAQDHPGGVFVVRLAGSDRRLGAGPRAVWSRFDQQLRLIGRGLKLPEQVLGQEDLLTPIRHQLDRRQPYLWVVDDVPSGVDEDLFRTLFAPTANGKTLITTRGRYRKFVTEEIELGPLSGRTGLALLTSQRPVSKADRAELTAAKDVVGELGEHALSLTLAAGLTTLDTFTGYGQLRAEIRNPRREALELAKRFEDELPAGYAKPFSAVLLRSRDGLTDAGREVLAAASVLAPTPIPRDLLFRMLERASRNQTWKRGETAEGLARLERHGFTESRGDDAGVLYRVHAMVSRAARVLEPETVRRSMWESAVTVLGEVLDATRGSFADRAVASYLPHVVAVAGLVEGTTEWEPGLDVWHIANEAGRVRYELGHSRQALDIFRGLYASCVASPACDELTRLGVLVGLGAACFGLGRYSEARELQTEAVRGLTAASISSPDIREDVLVAKSNLANTYSAMGTPEDLQAARSLLVEVYRDRRVLYGKTDPGTLTALNNLAIAVAKCGSDEVAKTRSRRLSLRYAFGALALWYRVAEPDAAGTLDCLTTIGGRLLDLGDAASALGTYQYVWERRVATLGADHPDTIGAAENIVLARRSLEARHTFHAAYADRLRVQGPDHPEAAHTLLRLLAADLQDSVDYARPDQETSPSPSELPDGLGPENVRLDGDHAELFGEVVPLAVRLQDRETVAFGPDHPRAMRATVLLAHALAAADQLDGQLEHARILVEDAREGLADWAARAPHEVEPADLEIAETVHHWILGLLGEDPEY